MKKRILCFLTSFIMIFSLVANVSATNVNAESITAENQSEISADNSEVSIEGTNSFGNLLTDSLEEKMNQQEENNGCNIFSIEMIDDSTAAVSFETLQDCMLVVGIYDEAGETMLASGSIEVYAGETDTYVDIETDSMPEYFYLKAFLIDTDCFRPVCNAYESPNYTQEMQEFLAKTTEDFDQEKVLNFDDDNTNNFAVFSEDTKVIPQTEDTNDVVSVDDENNVYVVENADSSITSLQAGDTFAYEYGDNDVLIVKVADIKLDGTTATITGEDTSLEEAFDYIKIDTESNSADAQVDASNLEDGITYEGMIESEDDSEVQTYGADLEGSKDLSLSFEMNDKKIGSAKVSGSVEFKLSVSAKVYISSSYQYIELKLEYSAKTVLSLSDKGNGKMPLAYMGFSPIPGLIIEVTSSIVLETSVKAEVSGTLKGCVGFKTSNTEGMVNLTKSPTFNPEIKIEGTIFVGISLEPKVKIISDKIASASMTAKVGAEVKGVLSKKLENNENSIHECKNCIDGDINAKVTLSFEAKLMNCDSLKFTLNLVNWSVKICDFYFSYDFAEFAFTSCPHCKYKVTVEVTDSDFNKVQGATVKIDDEEYKTDENGCVTVYFNNGNYKLAAQKSEVGTAQTTLTVDDNAIKKSMCLYKNSSNCDENNNDVKLSLRGDQSAVIMQDGNLYMWGCYIYDETGWGTTDSPIPIKIMDNVKSVSLGANHSAAITEDGSLYTWGYNDDGRLGNGTRTYSQTPKKIMDNVKSVSLGDGAHGAAITEDGSLYTWGGNNCGQLGNGTKTDSLAPIKIMDNVKSVSLGGNYSAAITEDGSLYTWGGNDCGQLGNGTTTDSRTPIKIMDNVKSVSLGTRFSAAITEDGSLYTWGENDCGQLGNGTTTDSRTPIKIMDNVKSVSLGGDYRAAIAYSAAIAEDGSLYTWGSNHYGQLGNGTTTDSRTPIKIMDNIKLVSLGGDHSAAIAEDGNLYTWGYNYYGQLGNGTTTYSLTPIEIMDNVKSVSLGDDHSAAITEDGSLYTWGYNHDGELGNGTKTDSQTPIKIMDNVKSVSLGDYHSAAITEDGSLYTWGRNYRGELGNGTKTDSLTPIKIMDNVKSVSLGDDHSAAITEDGSLYTWGYNRDGQLGNGTTTDSRTPIKIMDNIKLVSLGGNHSAAITEDGSLYTWGRNYRGQLGNGTNTDSLTPIKIMDNVKSVSLGGGPSAAITEDGSLYTWGWNYYGQLGNGTKTDSQTPIKIMDNVKSVSIDDVCSAAITEDGSLYTWGRNYLGQLGNGTRTESLIPIKIMDNVKSVSLGGVHSAAITEDGSLYTWGWNYYGQLGSGTTDSLTPIKITIPVEIATASVTSVLAPTCTLSTLSVVDTSIKSFSDMRANEIYNVYAIKSADAENILEADNLLYITQVLSNENGTLSVPYGFDEEYDDPVWLVVPMTQTDISSAEITVDDLQYTGENQSVKPVVKLNGETLVEGEAYYLEKDYSAVEPGEYTVIVTGFGLYKGSVEVSYKVIETNGVALRGSNLTLNGNIGLNFYFEIDKSLKDIIFADQTAKVRFTLADGSTVDVAANTGLEDTSAMEGLTLYRYSCELTAKQMADNVTVQFIMNDKVIAEYEHSVVDYAKIIIENAQNAYSAEVIALVKAMLNYGANAQLNFGYHTENLANSLTDADGNAMITEEEKDLSSVTTATFEPYKATGTAIDGLGKFAAANLVLKSETTLKVYFKPAEDITLDMLTFKVGDNEVTATEYGEYFMISIPNIKASALDDKYVITVTSKTDSTKTGTFDAYVYSYCYSVLKDSTGTYTEQLKDTLRALYVYNVVANSYFN